MTTSDRFLLFDPVGDAWPAVRLPQVAFAGRSNVGKSSLLNALVGQSRLARVSNTPGRTRGIALFEVEGRFAFADLPGYGFAKVARSEREAWKGLVEGYLDRCDSLRRVHQHVDAPQGVAPIEVSLHQPFPRFPLGTGDFREPVPGKVRDGEPPLHLAEGDAARPAGGVADAGRAGLTDQGVQEGRLPDIGAAGERHLRKPDGGPRVPDGVEQEEPGGGRHRGFGSLPLIFSGGRKPPSRARPPGPSPPSGATPSRLFPAAEGSASPPHRTRRRPSTSPSRPVRRPGP